MKTLVTLLLFVLVVNVNGQVTIKEKTALYSRPVLESKYVIDSLTKGQVVTLLNQEGIFWKVNSGNNTGYVHGFYLSNWQPPQNAQVIGIINDQTPGDALIKAGRLQLLGTALSVAGAALPSLTLISGSDSNGVIYGLSGVLVLTGGIMGILAWLKIQEAGDRLNKLGIGLSNSGVGLTFRLN